MNDFRFATNDFTLDPEKIKDNRIHVTNFGVNKGENIMMLIMMMTMIMMIMEITMMMIY